MVFSARKAAFSAQNDSVIEMVLNSPLLKMPVRGMLPVGWGMALGLPAEVV
jgi:hypothetical protein